MAAEQPRRRELAELVTDHVLGHVHRNELVAVVHGERVPDEVGDDRARARPRLHDALLVARVHRRDALRQTLVDVRALFYRSSHSTGMVLKLSAISHQPSETTLGGGPQLQAVSADG